MPLTFIDNTIITAKPEKYKTISVSSKKVLSSWKNSLFSFEWLLPDGSIRQPTEMQDTIQSQFETIQKKIDENQPLKRPILGVGLMDNVEIGSGKDILLTLAARNHKTIEVHILKNDEDFFKGYEHE